MLNLDLSKVVAETSSMFSKVPDGDYVVSVALAQFKDGKKPGAAGLQVGYMVEEGAHKGKMIQDYINIANANEKAVEIGHRSLRAIMELQERKSFILKTDAELVSRATFIISTVLETSTYNDKEIESVSVKKLTAIEKSAVAAKKKAPVVTEEVTPAVDDSSDDETPPWLA